MKNKMTAYVCVVESHKGSDVKFVTDFKEANGSTALDYDMKYAKIFQTRNGAKGRVYRMMREDNLDVEIHECVCTLGKKVN